LDTPKALRGRLHHVELYVSDLENTLRFWDWFLGWLGYTEFQRWDNGVSFILDDTYIVFVQTTEKHLEPKYHRYRTGLNHLAFHAASKEEVDALTRLLGEQGIPVLYLDRHPHAGGEESYAVFFEDPDRIKIEFVAP